MSAARTPADRRARGFTLIEVLVAMFIMAILAALAFRGIDALVHAKDGALASTDRTLKLNTGMSQFEVDVTQIVDSKVMSSPVMFDGATLRLTRRSADGVQLVLWTLQDHRWQRWASPAVTHIGDLTDQWMRSQQWDAIAGNAVTVLRDVEDFQVYLCNPNNNIQSGCSWNNVGTTSGNGGGGVLGSPDGIRITLKVPEGVITREKELPHW